MIRSISVAHFKSIEAAKIELGNLNVFVGANGSGKSNLLEAIGVLSAAADGKVNDQTLLQRGVRPGVPKSAFPSIDGQRMSHIDFSGSSAEARYEVSLDDPSEDTSPSWRFETEVLERGTEKLAIRGPNLPNNPNTEAGLAALKAVELKESDAALALMRRLQNYVIYSPATPVLRGVAPETQPRQPLGLSGGRLPEAVHELLLGRPGNELETRVYNEVVDLIGWAESYDSGRASAPIPLSQITSVYSRPMGIFFRDKYMQPGRNVLPDRDVSEGALFVLFLSVLAIHPKAPSFCAVDNADHGLNPGLATALTRRFADWVLSTKDQRQVLITSHNPAVLDGLPLQDDRVRLFTVDRDNRGKTIVERVIVNKKLLDMADKGWTLSRLWMNKLIGGMPNV
jgi:energy-coupling factor transporter ATP-binding protein EcfA2